MDYVFIFGIGSPREVKYKEILDLYCTTCMKLHSLKSSISFNGLTQGWEREIIMILPYNRTDFNKGLK